MNNMYIVEEYFLRVEELFNQNKFPEGKKLLEEILEMEPGYGRAHNHLGWLYYTRFDQYETAANHFRLGMKFAPEYPANYINYLYLMNQTQQYAEVQKMFEKVIGVPGVNRCIVYKQLAKSFEMTADYKKAAESFRNAMQFATEQGELDEITASLERIRTKEKLAPRKFFLF